MRIFKLLNASRFATRLVLSGVILGLVAALIAVSGRAQQEGRAAPPAQPQEGVRSFQKATLAEKPTLAPVDEPSVIQANTASTANYAFLTNATSSLALDLNANAVDMTTGTTTLSAASVDEGTSAATNIGFDFFLMGNRYSQFNVTSNGLVSLSSTGTTAAGSNYVASGGTTTTPIISAFAADLGTGTSGKTHYKVFGTAPNRVLVIEFNNMTLLWTSSFTNDGTYQVRLYESTGVIEFVYGTMSITATGSASDMTASIGFSTNSTANNLAYVTSSTNAVATTAPFVDNSIYPTGAIANLNSAANGSRRSYRFTPTAPTAPTALSFTAIAPAGMTLNWVDAPNEVGYAIYRSTDGTNYTFAGSAASDAVLFNATGLSPSTNYFWRVVAVSEGALSSAISGSQATNPPGNIACSGAGGAWSSTATWVGGVLPSGSDNVVLASGCTVTIDVTTATALNVNVQTGGILQYISTPASTLTVVQGVAIDSGGVFQSAATGTVTTHLLSVGTDLTNNGTLNFSTNANTAGAGITFTGAANNTFGGTGATTNIRTLTVNKGVSLANILELSPSSFTVQGVATDGTAAAFLTLTNGTLKVSGTFTANYRTFTSAGYTIGATTGFWLNNPNYTVTGQASSPTNNGLLRVSTGIFNIGSASGNAMGAGAGASFTFEGGTVNIAGRLNTANAVTYTQTAGTVNVCTVGNASSATYSFAFIAGTFNMSGGTINLVQINSTASATNRRDYEVVSTSTITGGTLNIGTAATTGNTGVFDFRVFGFTPSLVVDNTTNAKNLLALSTGSAGSLALIVNGSTTINSGASLNANGFLVEPLGDVTNNGAIVGTAASSRFDFAGLVAQTYSGTGTFGTLAAPFGGTGVGVANALGVTLNSPIITTRVNLFLGQFINSNQISLGAGGAAAVFVQRGGGGGPSGAFDVAPTFNLGTGTYQATYTTATNAVTTSVEIPPSRALTFLTINNANGVTVAGGNLSVATTLTMTIGNLNTTASNLVTVTGTPTTAISGGSATSFVNGPLARNLPASLVTGSTYAFPVGKSALKLFELVNPTTNAGGTVTVQAEAFDASSGGTAGTGIDTLFTNRYWQASITAGAANFTNTAVRLTDVPLGNRIGQSATQTGVYNAIGGSVVGAALQSTAVTSLGFFSMGVVSLPAGTYTVGGGGNYATLTAAIADLNSKSLAGPVVLSLTDPNYSTLETFPLVITANSGSSATNTVIIKPAVGVTSAIIGTSTAQIFDLNGIKFLTIDGSNAVGGSSQDLTIRNASTGTASSTLRLINDATNDTVKNTIVEGASANTSGGVVLLSTGITTGNDNNTITGNTVRDRSDLAGVPTNLFYSAGTSGAITNTNNVISNNTLKNFTATGMTFTATGNESWTVSGNTIFEEAARTTGLIGISFNSLTTNTITQNTMRDLNTSSTVTGMLVANAFGTTISRNRIFSIPSTSGSTNAMQGIRHTGGSGLLTSVTLSNNQIVLVPLFTNSQTVTGIEDDGFTGNVFNVYFNSVLVGGTATGTLTTAYRRAISTPTTTTIRDNIFFNNRTGGTVNHFAVADESLGAGSWSSDNNLYVGTGTTAANFFDLGTLASGTPVSFAAWKTGAPVRDANAQSSVAGAGNYTFANLFLSASDLHLNVAGVNPALASGNATGTGVNSDFDNDLRDDVPDLGADEIVSGRSGTIPAGSYHDGVIGPGTLTGDATFTGTVTLNGIVDAGAFTMTVNCGSTIAGAGAGSYVMGNLKEMICAPGAFTYPVGTANGYSPVNANVTATGGSGSDSLAVKAVQGYYGQNAEAPALDPASLQRYWDLNKTGSITADVKFNFLPGDVMSGGTGYNVIRVSGTNAAAFLSGPGCGVNPTASPCVDVANNFMFMAGISNFSKWTAGKQLAPTAAGASIGGRVMDAGGRPIGNALVMLSGGGLTQPRLVQTGPFGYYTFDNLASGQTYVVTVSSGRFTFAEPSLVVNLNSDALSENFIANDR